MLYVRKQDKNRIKLKYKILFFAMSVTMLFSAVIYTYLRSVKPIVTDIATSQVEVAMMRSVNDAAITVLTDNRIDYSDIITIHRDNNDGKVSSVTLNSVLMNFMNSELINKVVEIVESHPSNSVKRPIGSILSPTFFSGHGPELSFDLMPVSAVYADYENTFSAAGINQTRHTVSVKITVSSGVYLPGYSAETTIETHIIIAETVIVGAVPNDFANIEGLGDENSYITDLI